jgi:hypothetical protein
LPNATLQAARLFKERADARFGGPMVDSTIGGESAIDTRHGSTIVQWVDQKGQSISQEGYVKPSK